MNCEEALTWIMQVLDGETGPDGETSLSEHLQACPTCRSRWEYLRKVNRMLRAAPAVSPPPGLTARVLTRIEQHRCRRNVLGGLALALGTATVFMLSLLPLLAALPGMPVAFRACVRAGEVLAGRLVSGFGSLLHSLWLSAEAFLSLVLHLLVCGMATTILLVLVWLSAMWKLYNPVRRTG